MWWYLSNRCDREVRPLADRHYNRQSVGAANFVPPGRCLVLKLQPCLAYWVTSWPFSQYVKHEWKGAWICSAFRNEASGHIPSDLILEAVAATRWKYPDVPELGMVTFVDPTKVQSKNPGYCFKQAGFVKVGKTKSGLDALQLFPELMPEPQKPRCHQMSIFDCLAKEIDHA